MKIDPEWIGAIWCIVMLFAMAGLFIYGIVTGGLGNPVFGVPFFLKHP